jgi:hypothetical protein
MSVMTQLLRTRTLAIVASLLGVLAFSWPFIAAHYSLPHSVVGTTAVFVAIGALSALLLSSAARFVDSRMIALVGVLAALAAAARLLSVGAGGIEFIFVMVIIAGYVLGPRGGFLVGALAMVVSSLVWGGVGPWTVFQMLAVGWVGAGAGLLPHRFSGASRPRLEIGFLAAYGVVASYAFGLLMNLWFWPISIGSGTSLSLVDGEGVAANFSRFLLYSLTTSTLTWDSVRAITTVVSLVLIGGAALKALRRVSPARGLDREVLRLRVVEHERVG